MGARVALLTGWAGLVAGVLIVLILARRRGRTLDELTRSVAALGEGRPPRVVHAWAGGAAGRLARRFNEVAPRLDERIKQLEGDRQLLRAVLEGMTEGVVAIDARRRLLFANDAAGRLFGLGPESVGRLVAEVIRVPQVQHAVATTLSGPKSFQDEITVPGAVWNRGPTLVLAVQGTPLPGSPPPGAVAVFHDITETRRLERVRQDFVANASHELKTPLAAIKAYTETLLDGALHDDDVNRKFLLCIDEQAERLNRLILDLLSLARLESGQDFFQHAPLDLAPVVRRSVESQVARAEAKGLELLLTGAAEADRVVVTADEEAIRQILDNLIDNAIKYTPTGGSVRVALSSAEQQDGAVIEVVDTGIGIPRDDLPRVFERFYRVDKARSRELGGTGLGLSIVKHLVQSLGGQVTVDSRLGHGSTFTVRLPRSRQGRSEVP
jgi:two-component system phosphate regulon sensor histidine kinase PhoR